MVAEIIDGRAIAGKVKDGLKERVEALRESGIQVKIGTILVGGNDASKVYIRMKEKGCSEIGAIQEVRSLPEYADESDVLALIEELNKDKSISGIIVEQPLPKGMNKERILKSIDPDKDLDGSHPVNSGRLLSGDEWMLPSTPAAVVRILEEMGLEFPKKYVVVVSHSTVVGKPLAIMLLNRNATVSVVHEFTKNLGDFTKEADVVVTAAGVPGLISGDMLKSGSVVVDVSMNRVDGGLCGDVVFNEAKKAAGAITPVPGGVGPVTVSMLLSNAVKAAERTKT